MNILRKIFFYLFDSLAIVLSAVLAFIEIRTIVSGDWALAESPIANNLSYGFRAVFFVFAFLLFVARFVGEAKGSKPDFPLIGCLYGALGVGCVFLFFHFVWYLALAFTVLACLTLLLGRFHEKR